MHNLKFQLSIA